MSKDLGVVFDGVAAGHGDLVEHHVLVADVAERHGRQPEVAGRALLQLAGDGHGRVEHRQRLIGELAGVPPVALDVGPAVVATLDDDVDFLEGIAAGLADDERAVLGEGHGVRIAEADREGLGGHAVAAERRDRGDGHLLPGLEGVHRRVVLAVAQRRADPLAVERIDAEDLAEGVVQLRVADLDALDGAVAVQDVEQLGLVDGRPGLVDAEHDLADRVVVDRALDPQQQPVRLGQAPALLVAELDEDALFVDGVVREVALHVRQRRLELRRRLAFHGRDVDQPVVRVAEGMQRHGAHAGVLEVAVT
mmetsp:Transcript_18107/g.55433  ORF Transcript_18107/g.55433 Transcript_18107/m.55433 type:complete len:307 (+) Transcript_18107:618-1538(+)